MFYDKGGGIYSSYIILPRLCIYLELRPLDCDLLPQIIPANTETDFLINQ